MILPLMAFSQEKSEWKYIADLTNDKNNPLIISVGNTDVILDGGFKVETDTATIYKQDGTIQPLENELYLVRFGFDYRIADNVDFAQFKAYLETGGSNPPVPIGEYRVSDHQGWVQYQETFCFWGSSDIANDGGKIYWETSKGTAQIANQNLTIVRLRDERPRPLLEIGNVDNTNDVANTNVGLFTELYQEVRINTREDYFSVDLSQAAITVKKPGVYKISVGFSLSEGTASNTQRNNISVWFEDGTSPPTGPDDDPSDNITHYFQGNYNRDTSGHLETSDGGSSRWIVIDDTMTPYTFFCSRDLVSGAGGVQYLQGTNNFVQLEKVD